MDATLTTRPQLEAAVAAGSAGGPVTITAIVGSVTSQRLGLDRIMLTAGDGTHVSADLPRGFRHPRTGATVTFTARRIIEGGTSSGNLFHAERARGWSVAR